MMESFFVQTMQWNSSEKKKKKFESEEKNVFFVSAKHRETFELCKCYAPCVCLSAMCNEFDD